MRQTGCVFMVQIHNAADAALAQALRGYRWRVVEYQSWERVFADLRNFSAEAVVVQGECEQIPQRIAALRQAAPGAALVWQAHASACQRIAALDAGADTCLSAAIEAREWDALLRNLSGRRRAVPGPAPCWHVDGQASVLAGPAGERLPLTANERAFFIRLLNAPGQCLARERFFPSCSEAAHDGARRVDVLVSRLRSKARRLNIDLPVVAVRGWGYMMLPAQAEFCEAIVEA